IAGSPGHRLRIASVAEHTEGPGVTRAAEPPADPFATLALPAHNQRESRHSRGRRRREPAFPDHWAVSRTEMILRAGIRLTGQPPRSRAPPPPILERGSEAAI